MDFVLGINFHHHHSQFGVVGNLGQYSGLGRSMAAIRGHDGKIRSMVWGTIG